MTKYFYLKTMKELERQNLSINEAPTYVDEMDILATRMKGKKVKLEKNFTYWHDDEIGCNWNDKWLKEGPTQIEFDFNA